MNQPTVTTPGEALPSFADDEPVIPRSLRSADGPVPCFGDTGRWDCTSIARAPNQPPSAHVLNFEVLTGEWNLVARLLTIMLLNPTHPVLRARGVFRSTRPAAIKTIRTHLDAIRLLQAWATDTGRAPRLSSWDQADFAAYFGFLESSRSPSTVRSSSDLLRILTTMRPLAPDLVPSVEIESLAKRSGAGEIRTRPIEPDSFWPLVRATWAYIDVFGPDAIAAQKEIDALESTRHSDGDRLAMGEYDRLIDAWISGPDSFIPLHVGAMGRGVKDEVNWDGLALLVFPGKIRTNMFNTPPGVARRQRVFDAVAGGLPTRHGITRAVTPRLVARPDGTQMPWCAGFDKHSASFEITRLRAAAYIFTGIMTMMRDSELQGLAPGCLGTRQGAPVVHSRVHKHQDPGGSEQVWWVSEPVVQAIKTAEQIALQPDRIFGSIRGGDIRDLRGFDVHDEIQRFIQWVNATAVDKGLEPISDVRIAPHRFRRTMAVITANEPDGEIALGITLKHNATRALANATTSGYGAPTAAWAREFGHEAQNATAAELVSEWSQHAEGQRISRGPGAAAFNTGLDHVTSQYAQSPAHIGDDRTLRNLLRDEFSDLRIGTLNHCLGAADKAECLKGLPDDAKAGGPIPSLCSPVTCRNSVITERHTAIWQSEQDELERLLSDRRIAPAHRERLKQQLDQVRRITGQESR